MAETTKPRQPGRHAAGADDPRPTDSYLGFLLVRAALRLRAVTAEALSGLALSPQQFGLLNHVVLAPGLTQAQLGSQLGIDRTTVVAMLDRLMEAGWIVRVADADDRRIYRISATPAGRQLHRRAQQVVIDVERVFTASLDAAQRTTLDRALAALARGEAPE